MLTPQQRRIAQLIYGVGRSKHVRRKTQLAALETGLVEANLSNPRGGSGTSAGWRQEISSYGSVGRRRNVRGAAGRFFDEARAKGGARAFGTAGQEAQAVQRSAYPGRYDQRKAEAERVLRWLEKTQGKAPPSGGQLTGKLQTTPGVSHAADRLALKQQYLLSKNKSPTALLNLGQQLNSLADTPGQQTYKLGRTPVKGGGGGGGNTPVRLAAGADRPGVKTSHYLRRVLSGVQGIPGGITITTGSNHNQMTVNGNVSDHWTGHAADIAVPVDSSRGDLIAGRALMRLGVPRAKARVMAQRGGLFNVDYGGHRWQVIWRTNQGGNHHNHVHVGVR